MKTHNFNESEVRMLSRRISHLGKRKAWEKFTQVCYELDIDVCTTGGNFLTHEIYCDEDDFMAILELTKEQL